MATRLNRSVIQHSVGDTIRLIENSPVRWDMRIELPIAEAMNRVSIAHLSIERAMKFVIAEAGGPVVKDHDLPSRLKELRQYEPNSAAFLEEAFKDAVQHYRYNPNVEHMKHLQSLEKYLNATGSDKDFQDIRYWELNQSTDELIVRHIYLTLHIELLHAVRELLIPPGRTKETTSLRVERTVQNGTRPYLGYLAGTDRETSVKKYIQWLRGFESDREAITAALMGKEPPEDEFTLEIIGKTHDELANSSDPAVKYFAETLTVLPHQPRDAISCVEWLGPEKYQFGEVSTPGGDNLGFIRRRPDGLWNIEPIAIHMGRIAETQTDARCYLAQVMTRPARVTVNGEERNLRIVGEEHNIFKDNYSQWPHQNYETYPPTFHRYEVNFWDASHGLTEGDRLKLEVSSIRIGKSADVLEGTVTQVTSHKVSISGLDYIARIDSS